MESTYKQILENLPIATYVILPDENYTIKYMSEAIYSITRYKKSMFENNVFYRSLIHPDDKSKVISSVENAIENKEPFEFTYRIINKFQEIVWIYEHGKAIYNKQGDIEYFTGMLIDISGERNLESLLKNREEILNAILSSTRLLYENDDYRLVLDQCFKLIGNATNADRVYFYKIHLHHLEEVTSITHEWTKEGVSPHLEDENQQNIPLDGMKQFFSPLFENKPFNAIVSNIKDTDLRTHLEAQSIKSLIVLPIFVGDKLYAFVGFDDIHKKRPFDAIELSLLETFSKNIATNIQRYKYTKKLEEDTLLFDTIFEAIDEGVCVLDDACNIIHENKALKSFQSLIPECHLSKNKELLCLDDCIIKRVFEKKKFEVEVKEITSKGKTQFVEVYAYPIIDKQSNKVRMVVQLLRDITKRKQDELTLKKLSETDKLTQVYNRNYFEKELTRIDRESIYPYAIISIDLDGLKLINDTLGHQKGDELLKVLANILKNNCDQSSLIARIGGDEFGVIIYGDKEKALQGMQIIDRACKAYSMKYPDIYFSISMGIAHAEKGKKAIQVLKHSDDEMYTQKLKKGQSTKSHIIQTLIGTLKERDYLTDAHAQRLVESVQLMGKALQLSQAQITNLEILAQVHDLGKIGIPDEILFKPGPLDENEWEIMKTHPEKGYRIASNSYDLFSISEFILKHHEHYDGQGYPLGLSKDEIPIECRVLAICDAYDAMISDRPYRQALSEEQAISELLNQKGRQFDPSLVDIFVNKVLKKAV